MQFIWRNCIIWPLFANCLMLLLEHKWPFECSLLRGNAGVYCMQLFRGTAMFDFSVQRCDVFSFTCPKKYVTASFIHVFLTYCLWSLICLKIGVYGCVGYILLLVLLYVIGIPVCKIECL